MPQDLGMPARCLDGENALDRDSSSSVVSSEDQYVVPRVTQFRDESFGLAASLGQVGHGVQLKGSALRSLLEQHQKYPDDYRGLIWRFLLRLPRNTEAFECLLRKGPHPTTEWQLRRYHTPAKSVLGRVLSCLAWHCSALGAVEELPELVHPFAQVFHADPCAAFEASLTFLLNWGQDYFS
eukprot:RCo024801